MEAERSEDHHSDPDGGGFCLEPSLYPILHPGSSHVARPKTHVWVHTKSAGRGAATMARQPNVWRDKGLRHLWSFFAIPANLT